MNYDLDTEEGMANAVAWQERHLARIAEGGVWMVPRSGSLYQIFKEKKIAVRLTGFAEDSIAKVFAKMGWVIRDRRV